MSVEPRNEDCLPQTSVQFEFLCGRSNQTTLGRCVAGRGVPIWVTLIMAGCSFAGESLSQAAGVSNVALCGRCGFQGPADPGQSQASLLIGCLTLAAFP